MADLFRTGTDQTVVRDPADINHIVRNQLMTALDQLQRGFAFAYAAFS